MSAPAGVCRVLSSFRPVVGGVQRGTEAVARTLVEAGVPVAVLTRQRPGLPRRERTAGVEIVRAGLPLPGKVGALSFAAHGLLLLATRLRRYRIVHVHNVDTPLLLGMACRLLLGRPLVATVHGERKLIAKRATRRGRARLWAMRRLVDAHAAITPAVGQGLRALGVPPARIHAIPNGVDTRRFRPADPAERAAARARLGLRADATVFACVGRLVELKRVDVVLRAWAHAGAGPEAALLIVGDGPDRARLERLAGELRVRNVVFAGVRDDVAACLHAADAYVSASSTEGLSMALLEAMACGLAPIVTDLPGVRSVVRHGENGLVVPVDDVDALRAALERCRTRHAERRRVAQRAADTARAGHTMRDMAARHVALYRTLSPPQETGHVGPRREARAPARSGRHEASPLWILRLAIGAGAESAPYNQFTLGAPPDQRITFCSLLPFEGEAPPDVAVRSGDGTIRGFLRAVNAALAAGPYHLVHVHSPHVALLWLVRRALGRAPRIPAVATVHNSYSNYRPRNRLLLLPAFAGFDRVVCCSRSSLESFPGPYRRLAGRRLRAVANGVDLRRVDRATAGERPDPGAFTVIGVGRLTGIKNPGTVLDAFGLAFDRRSRLVLVGAGPLEPELMRRAHGLVLENRVAVTGRLPREEVYRRLARANVFVSASRGEGLPVAVLEAMACALPVVLSDIPPHREIAGDDSFIPLVRPDDAIGFAREIARIRAMAPEQRLELGRRCRRRVEERFGLDAMHRQYASIFAELVPHARPAPRPRPAEPEEVHA